MKKLILSLLVVLMTVPSASIKAQENMNIMTTFYPVYYLASRIGGDKVYVSMLLEKGQDAHSYEVTGKDVVNVQDSDLFIYQDDEMEFFVQDLLSVVDEESTQVLESTQGLDLLSEEDRHHDEEVGHDHEEEGHNHDFDPHTWLDPIFYSQQAMNVRDALIEADPDNAKTYEANAQQLIDDLNTLDSEFQEGLASREDRTIVVQHEAFGYLAHAYDLEQVAITGLATNAEPSAQELIGIAKFVEDNNIEIIYIDPNTSSSISETVANTTGAELRPLRTLEFVSNDEMEAGVDYFTIMSENLQQLKN